MGVRFEGLRVLPRFVSLPDRRGSCGQADCERDGKNPEHKESRKPANQHLDTQRVHSDGVSNWNANSASKNSLNSPDETPRTLVVASDRRQAALPGALFKSVFSFSLSHACPEARPQRERAQQF